MIFRNYGSDEVVRYGEFFIVASAWGGLIVAVCVVGAAACWWRHIVAKGGDQNLIAARTKYSVVPKEGATATPARSDNSIMDAQQIQLVTSSDTEIAEES